jgi:hypothetical protein
MTVASPPLSGQVALINLLATIPAVPTPEALTSQIQRAQPPATQSYSPNAVYSTEKMTKEIRRVEHILL